MAGASFDDSELRRFAADLTSAGAQFKSVLVPIVTKGAVNIKKQMVADMRGSTHFKTAAADISFDVSVQPDAVEAEIGPEAGLANLAYFGAETGVYRSGRRWSQVAYYGDAKGGGTVPDPQLALEAEMPNFERYINALIDGAL